jgi:hypothetical protein
MAGLYMGTNIPEVERQKASKALNCDRQFPLWVMSKHSGPSIAMSALPPKPAFAGASGMSAKGQKRTSVIINQLRGPRGEELVGEP